MDLDIIKNLYVPTNYGSLIANKIGEKKMVGFKSHDWHGVLHDPLSIIMGNINQVYKKNNV